MSFIINCTDDKIKVDINNENIKKSKFLITSYEEGDKIFIPFSYKIVENYIKEDFKYDIKFETVYNFLNYLIVDNDIMIKYLSYILYKIDFDDAKYYIENFIDKSFLKALEQKEGFIKCAENNDIVGVFIGIKSGVNVNIKNVWGRTALHFASEYGHTAIVKLLLDYGADVNIKYLKYENALYFSSRNGHTELVKLLIESGADINVKDLCNMTALHYASLNGYIKIVQVLLETNIDINIQDIDGYTALHHASSKGHTEVVMLLLKFNSDVNIKTRFGEIALHTAYRNCHIEVVIILNQYT